MKIRFMNGWIHIHITWKEGKGMKIVFMGTPIFAQVILEALIEAHDVIGVVTQPDRLVGRKKIPSPSPVKEVAMKHQIDVFQPMSLSQDYASIKALNPDIFITAAYGQFVPKALLEFKPNINVHGSLLPMYRGGAPIQYAIKDGLLETGVTIMHMVSKMDAGNIIDQVTLPIETYDTYSSLSLKMSKIGAQLLQKVLKTYGTNLPKGSAQDDTKVTFAYTLKRDDERLDYCLTCDQFINQMRALLDQPVGHILVKELPVKIYDAKKSDIIKRVDPGVVISTKKRLTIQLKDGAIDILKIQLPGKKVLSIEQFLNGQNIFYEGMTLKE